MLHWVKCLFILTMILLTACSRIYGPNGVFQNRGRDYLSAECIPPLKIPPGMSSSTMESHYPVSERAYPKCKEEVKLIPPGLSAVKVQPKPVVVTKKSSCPANPVTQGYTASTSDERSLPPNLQQQAATHYYDSYTRSSTGGVGKPMGSILRSIDKVLPRGRKPASQNPALFGKANHSGATATVPAQPSEGKPTGNQTPVQEKPPGKSLSSIVKSLWPWGKSKDDANQGTQTASASTIANTNDSSQNSSQASTMQNMYFDRYTRR